MWWEWKKHFDRAMPLLPRQQGAFSESVILTRRVNHVCQETPSLLNLKQFTSIVFRQAGFNQCASKKEIVSFLGDQNITVHADDAAHIAAFVRDEAKIAHFVKKSHRKLRRKDGVMMTPGELTQCIPGCRR